MPQNIASFAGGDYADSDEMPDILEFTSRIVEHTNPAAHNRNTTNIATEPSDLELKMRRSDCEAVLRILDEDLAELNESRKKKAREIEELTRQLQSRSGSRPSGSNKIDYQTDIFDWEELLVTKRKAIFNVQDFRLCQRGVCNANVDGRDIICVMPWGEGGSLTYQLPALLAPGVTVVVSPLTLIDHQVMDLRSRNVEAVKLLGTTKGDELNQINDRLLEMAEGNASGDSEIKLCFVTPDKIIKDDGFLKILRGLNSKRKLSRIVLDEADCVSMHGHKFRLHYKNMHVLRSNLPGVPIMALSASCTPKVLEDITKVLQLPRIVGGENANTDGTVYFAVQGAQCSEAGPSAVVRKKEDIVEGESSNTYGNVKMEG
ncbi:P-loop containing nucleoside triphosphate hydrolase protein [Ephemerocybe angulata]|uniref:DNA 3'-5' helicase n=1 Tax=Ephemerocybe angulata TaxID=980116 RepID=A0A8H6HAR1_9AGAR|nr:P-loop containing nucleoside triphosphate hydrolase protein [Tulosesus angulatus]